jgi:hypothetical protein
MGGAPPAVQQNDKRFSYHIAHIAIKIEKNKIVKGKFQFSKFQFENTNRLNDLRW